MKPGDFYDTNYFYSMERRYYFGAHGERVRDIISFLPIDARVLDYGCGSGFFSHQTIKKGNDVVAFDFSEHSRRFTREHYPEVNVVEAEADIHGLFNVILLLDIIEHIDYEAQEAFIKKIAGWLGKSGNIILSTDNINSFFWNNFYGQKIQFLDMRLSREGRNYRLIKQVEAKIPYHKRYHDSHVGLLGRDKIIKLMQKCGFSPVKEKHGFLFRSPASTIVSKLFRLRPVHSVYKFQRSNLL